jgi:hypothetical protein
VIVDVFEEAEFAESSLDLVTAATFHWRNPDRSNGDYPIALSVEAGGCSPFRAVGKAHRRQGHAFRALTTKGVVIYDDVGREIEKKLPGLLEYLQVLSLPIPIPWLPLEACYDLAVPMNTAGLCEGWREATIRPIRIPPLPPDGVDHPDPESDPAHRIRCPAAHGSPNDRRRLHAAIVLNHAR